MHIAAISVVATAMVAYSFGMRVEYLETAVSLALLLGPLIITLWWGRKLLRLLPVPVLLILSKSVWADYGLERSTLALGGVAVMWAMAAYVYYDAKRRLRAIASKPT